MISLALANRGAGVGMAVAGGGKLGSKGAKVKLVRVGAGVKEGDGVKEGGGVVVGEDSWVTVGVVVTGSAGGTVGGIPGRGV